jgi:hypothetical protein
MDMLMESGDCIVVSRYPGLVQCLSFALIFRCFLCIYSSSVDRNFGVDLKYVTFKHTDSTRRLDKSSCCM